MRCHAEPDKFYIYDCEEKSLRNNAGHRIEKNGKHEQVIRGEAAGAR